MERREFVGAMLAVFCSVALPPPMVRESIRVADQVWWTTDEISPNVWAKVQPQKDAFLAVCHMYDSLLVLRPDRRRLITRVRVA